MSKDIYSSVHMHETLKTGVKLSLSAFRDFSFWGIMVIFIHNPISGGSYIMEQANTITTNNNNRLKITDLEDRQPQLKH